MVDRASLTRRAAVDHLNAIFGGTALERWSECTDDAVLEVVGVDEATIAALRDEDTWDRALRDHDTNYPYLSHVSAASGDNTGRELSSKLTAVSTSGSSHNRVRVVATAAALADGDTIIANRVDQFHGPTLQRLCEDLQQLYGFEIHANAYVSRNGAEGFGSHWDDHEVLVLQLHGRKLWEAFAPTQLSPVLPYVHRDAAGATVWSGMLEAGQALLIPRGWAHRVIGLDELSVHYSFGIKRPMLRDTVDLALGNDLGDVTGATDLRTFAAARLVDPAPLVDAVLAARRGEIETRTPVDLLASDTWLHAGGAVADVEVVLPALPAFIGDPVEGELTLRWNGLDVTLTDHEAQMLAEWPPESSETATRFASELLVAQLARFTSAASTK